MVLEVKEQGLEGVAGGPLAAVMFSFSTWILVIQTRAEFVQIHSVHPCTSLYVCYASIDFEINELKSPESWEAAATVLNSQRGHRAPGRADCIASRFEGSSECHSPALSS